MSNPFDPILNGSGELSATIVVVRIELGPVFVGNDFLDEGTMTGSGFGLFSSRKAVKNAGQSPFEGRGAEGIAEGSCAGVGWGNASCRDAGTVVDSEDDEGT